MVSLLFQCPACRDPAQISHFPLCERCHSHLFRAPSLCWHCASATCNGPCERPWAPGPEHSGIYSYTARYLLIEPGYSVLKSWKKHGGPSLDRWILPSDKADFKQMTERSPLSQAEWIIPVPQNFQRSWRLGRSPAEIVARWLAKGLEKSVFPILEISRGLLSTKRQAEKSAQERIQSRFSFSLKKEYPNLPEKVILVDDFMTSGHTLRAAARTLRAAGVHEVHAFVLGVRPLRSR